MGICTPASPISSRPQALRDSEGAASENQTRQVGFSNPFRKNSLHLSSKVFGTLSAIPSQYESSIASRPYRPIPDDTKESVFAHSRRSAGRSGITSFRNSKSSQIYRKTIYRKTTNRRHP